MKKFFLLTILVLLAACQNNSTETTESYIVVYKKSAIHSKEMLIEIADKHAGEFAQSKPRLLGIINGFSAQFTESGIAKIAKEPQVKYVEKDGVMTIQ